MLTKENMNALFTFLPAFVLCLNLKHPCRVAVWLSGNTLALINVHVVALRRARLVLGCVIVRGYTILVYNQATHAYSASQPVHPSVGIGTM